MQTVISAEHVTKIYRLGQIGAGTLSEDLGRWLAVRKKHRSQTADGGPGKEHIALNDVSFQVKQGEVLGIIGKNGAGKSTLLKILSRVTAPTKGIVKIRGRVASLLEVGTGFHPDLTGRENVFLNGAILGMTKAEIKKRFDEIVSFSGVGKYIDTPVKRYSSGMYVRLAFAVAAHLEPEILIVDEVLAVGDAEFQKKCLGKMKDVSGQGRTVLFVSHNMPSVRNLCSRGVLLDSGRLSYAGEIKEVIDEYLRPQATVNKIEGMIVWENGTAPGGEEVVLRSIRLLNEKNEVAGTFYTSSPIKIEIAYDLLQDLSGSRLIIQLIDMNGSVVFGSTNHMQDSQRKEKGKYVTVCTIPDNLLNTGRYNVLVHMGIPGVKVLVQGAPFISFDTVSLGAHGSMFSESWSGMIAPLLKWETFKQSV